MHAKLVVLPVLLLAAIAAGACAPDTTIQVSVPTIGSIDITVGQGGSTPAPQPATSAPQAANPPASGPSGTGLSSGAALFFFTILAVVGAIVVITAFVLFMNKPGP